MPGSNSFTDPSRGIIPEARALESQLKEQSYEGDAKGAVAAKGDRSPKGAKGDPLPKAPPGEAFWQKYSPHYEFPLSNVAAVAAHIVVLLGIIYLTTRLMQESGPPSVPVRGQMLAANPGSEAGGPGSGASEERPENVDSLPSTPQRSIPAAELCKQIDKTSNWIPDLKDDPAALDRIVNSKNYETLDKLNEEIKERLKQGFGKKAGTGGEAGAGTSGNKGPGGGGNKSGPGDSAGTKSGERSMRWTLIFKTNSGSDYLKQLNAFKAKIVVPEPPDWKSNRLFEDITSGNPGKPLRNQELPEMYFTDSDKGSASKVARALGLDFDPPYFIAFFPKDVENELAEKERNYHNLKENEIYETKFRVLERDGKFIITVTDQTRVKK